MGEYQAHPLGRVISNINVYLFVSPQPQSESIWDGKRLTASSKGFDGNVYKTDPSLNQRIVVVSIISIALLQVVVESQFSPKRCGTIQRQSRSIPAPSTLSSSVVSKGFQWCDGFAYIIKVDEYEVKVLKSNHQKRDEHLSPLPLSVFRHFPLESLS